MAHIECSGLARDRDDVQEGLGIERDLRDAFYGSLDGSHGGENDAQTVRRLAVSLGKA
jgi:hypothetical protein